MLHRMGSNTTKYLSMLLRCEAEFLDSHSLHWHRDRAQSIFVLYPENLNEERNWKCWCANWDLDKHACILVLPENFQMNTIFNSFMNWCVEIIRNFNVYFVLKWPFEVFKIFFSESHSDEDDDYNYDHFFCKKEYCSCEKFFNGRIYSIFDIN